MDRIVYHIVDQNGIVINAFLNKEEANDNCNETHKVIAIVVDLEDLAKKTLELMDPVARLSVTLKTYSTTRSV